LAAKATARQSPVRVQRLTAESNGLGGYPATAAPADGFEMASQRVQMALQWV
jgi:hypothetical protein